MKKISTVILCTILLVNMLASPVIAQDNANDIPKSISNLILPIREVTEIKTVSQTVVIGDNLIGFNTQVTNKVSDTPVQPELSRAGSTLTHSLSQTITTGNSAACHNLYTRENHYLRTFTLEDFGISNAFNVTQVEFGIQALNISADIIVNLYTLDGVFTYANLTLIGTATAALDAQTLTVVPVLITGTAPAGATLVVEVVSLDLSGESGVFYVGSNSEGQTAPSYWAAPTCGHSEPVTTDSIGFPDMHIVMSVTGEPEEDSYEVFLPMVTKSYFLPATPVLDAIDNGGSSGYSVSWSASDGATDYLLEEDDNDAFTSPSTAYDGGNTSVSLSNGLGTYYYRVKAYNPVYSSGWSNVVSVIVTYASPMVGTWTGTISGGNAITMYVINNGTMIEILALDVDWGGSCGVISSIQSLLYIPISAGHFYKSQGTGETNVGGDFTSTTTANGTYFAFLEMGTCTASRSGTWSVTYSP